MLAKKAKDKPGDKKQDAIAEALARAQAKKAARASQGEATKKGESDQDDNSKDKEAQ